jgi:hypothetical protein
VSEAVSIDPSTANSIDHHQSGHRLITETGAMREVKAVAVATERALTVREQSAARPVLLRVKGVLAVAAGKVASVPGLTAAGASSAANLAAGRGANLAASHVSIARKAVVQIPAARKAIIRVLIVRVLKDPSAAIAAKSSARINRSGNFARGSRFDRTKRVASAGSRLFAESVLQEDSGLAPRADNGAIGERAMGRVVRASSLAASVPAASVLAASAATMTAGRATAEASAKTIVGAAQGGDAVKLRGKR